MLKAKKQHVFVEVEVAGRSGIALLKQYVGWLCRRRRRMGGVGAGV